MTVRSRAFTLGVVMLNTRFPRPLGDIGNPASFPFATRYRVVPMASVAAVVRSDPITDEVVSAIAEAVSSLAQEGADLIATSCGYLAPIQPQIQARVSIPVVSSSLLLLPRIRVRCGPGPIGILTLDSRRLTRRHFGRAFDRGDVVEGLESGRELYSVITENRATMDVGEAETDAVEAARRLLSRRSGLRAILLECTNLSPYRDAVAAETRLPVFDLNQAILDHAAGHDPLGGGAFNA